MNRKGQEIKKCGSLKSRNNHKSQKEDKKLIIAMKGNQGAKDFGSKPTNIVPIINTDEHQKGNRKKIQVKVGNFLNPKISSHSFIQSKNSSRRSIPISIVPFSNQLVKSSSKIENNTAKNSSNAIGIERSDNLSNKMQN